MPCSHLELSLTPCFVCKSSESVTWTYQKDSHFFHKSTTAAASLKVNQSRLELPTKKLIMDVSTRWNSSYEMLERFLEQQQAIVATVMSKEIRSLEQCVSLSADDTLIAENIARILKPVKTATTVLCSEKTPTVSLVYPLQNQLLQAMAPTEADRGVIRDLTVAFHTDLSKRFSDQKKFFTTAAALDPRFKSLPFSSNEEQLEVFASISTEASIRNSQVRVKKEGAPTASTSDSATTEMGQLMETQPTLPDVPALPTNPATMDQTQDASQPTVSLPTEQEPVNTASPICALGDLFPDTFITKVEPARSAHDRAQDENIRYRTEPSQPLSGNPLQWWKEKEATYPLLSALARYHLCVPATSVPSERVFLKAGQIVNDRRALINPKHVDYLIFLNKNVK